MILFEFNIHHKKSDFYLIHGCAHSRTYFTVGKLWTIRVGGTDFYVVAQPNVGWGKRRIMKTDAVIFDRDGTLASVEYIAPHGRTNAEWEAFNAALPFDAPVPSVVQMLRDLETEFVTRIIVSGRMSGDYPGDIRRRIQMRGWLDKHQIPYDFLYMREAGDLRLDSIVKHEIYHNRIEPFYNVLYVVDDRPQVIEMWKDHGLKVIEVKDPGILPPIVGPSSA
jgi:hypothetical protein